MKTKVYVLVCPISLKVRYIGITREKYLSKRLGGHIFDSINRNGKTYHHNWVRSLFNKGLKPIIKLLTICESWEDARKLELSLIRKYKISHSLTNSDDEGKFSSTGVKSARIYLTKPIYLYNDSGEFIKEFESLKLLCKELNIKQITAEKILNRKKKFGKNIKYKFQLSRIKESTLSPILNIGSRETTSPLYK